MKLLLVYVLIESQLVLLARPVDAGDQLNCRQIHCLSLNCQNPAIVRLCPEMCIRCINQRRANRQRSSSSTRRPSPSSSSSTSHHSQSQLVRSVRLPLPYFGSTSSHPQEQPIVEQLRSIIEQSNERIAENLKDILANVSRPDKIAAAAPIVSDFVDLQPISSTTTIESIKLDDQIADDANRLIASMQRTTVAIPRIDERKSIRLPFAIFHANNISTKNDDESIVFIRIRQPNETEVALSADNSDAFSRHFQGSDISDENIAELSSTSGDGPKIVDTIQKDASGLIDNHRQSDAISEDQQPVEVPVLINDPVQFSVTNLRSNRQHAAKLSENLVAAAAASNIGTIPQRFIVKLRKNAPPFPHQRHFSNESIINNNNNEITTTTTTIDPLQLSSPFAVNLSYNGSSAGVISSTTDEESSTEQISYLGSILQL